MSLPLTKLPGAPDNSEAIPGMAFFRGTGPAGKKCQDCEFWGCYRIRNSGATYKHSGCEKYKKMSGRAGPTVKGDNPSCKYFSQRPQP